MNIKQYYTLDEKKVFYDWGVRHDVTAEKLGPRIEHGWGKSSHLPLKSVPMDRVEIFDGNWFVQEPMPENMVNIDGHWFQVRKPINRKNPQIEFFECAEALEFNYGVVLDSRGLSRTVLARTRGPNGQFVWGAGDGPDGAMANLGLQICNSYAPNVVAESEVVDPATQGRIYKNKIQGCVSDEEKMKLFPEEAARGRFAHTSKRIIADDGRISVVPHYVPLIRCAPDHVELVNDQWTKQWTFPHDIITVRDIEVAITKPLNKVEYGALNYYAASKIEWAYGGPRLGNEVVVCRVDTATGPLYAYGKDIPSARSFVMGKMWDKYHDMILDLEGVKREQTK